MTMRPTNTPDLADTTVPQLQPSLQLHYQSPMAHSQPVPLMATLRTKTLSIVVLTQLGLLVICYLLLRVYWLGSFTNLESAMLTTDTQRVHNSIRNELHALDGFNASYAIWDDSYTYITGRDPAYIEKNYYDQFFSDNHLNLLLIVDPAGQIVFGKAFDLATQQTVPIPARLQQLAPSDPLITQLTATQSITGILQLPTAPMLIVSHAILTSQGAGPARGTFLMGRYLDTPTLQELATEVQLSFSIYRRDDLSAPADLAAAWAALGTGAPMYIQPIDNQRIYAYTLLPDLDHRSNLLVRVSTARTIYAQGRLGINYLIVAFLVAGFLFAGILVVLLERMMLARLAHLNASVSRIGVSGNLSMRVAVTGNDEVSRLASAFNATLSALEYGHDSQTQLYRDMHASEQQYRAMLDAVPDAMFRISANGTYLYFQEAKAGTGTVKPEMLVGKTIHDILAPALAQQTMAAIQDALATGTIQRFEFQLASTGHPQDFEARIVANGDVEVLAIVRDITERTKIDRMQRAFIATVSHELRTPVTAIRGALGLITRGVVGMVSLQAEQLLQIAYKNSERLVLLLNDILDSEKLETGTLSVVCEPLELGSLLALALEINRPYAAPFSVTFRLEPVTPDVWIDTDKDRLLQVLSNLLSNAAKFSPPGATVTIAMSAHEQRVRVSVTDTGSGIPESFRARIFTKFAQANVSDQRQRGGTGLGLSISRAIIEQLGGMIGYENGEEVGTTFYFELPVYQPASARD